MTTQQTFEFLTGYRPPRDGASRDRGREEKPAQPPSTAGLAVLQQDEDATASVRRNKPTINASAETAASKALNKQKRDQTCQQKPKEQKREEQKREEQKSAEQKTDSCELGVDPQDRQAILKHLRHRLGSLSCGGQAAQTWSTGAEAIDQLLPHGGLRTDAITEWVAEAEGCGAATLSLIAAAKRLAASGGRGPLVVVSSETLFFPPAAIAFGIPVDRILWVRPSRHADLVWSIDQALRSEAVAAVWAHVGPHLDDRDARRFQLAAETGGTPGLFVRPASTRGVPSFADIRFYVTSNHQNHLWDDNVPSASRALVESQKTWGDSHMPGDLKRMASSRVEDHVTSRLVEVTVDRCRGGQTGQRTYVQIDDQGRLHGVSPSSVHQAPSTMASRERRERDDKAAVRLASELAYPKTVGRKAERRRRA